MDIYKVIKPEEVYYVEAKNKAAARKEVLKKENILLKKTGEEQDDTMGKWIFLEQDDPRWKDVRIGTSNLTVGQQGCLITDLSMMSYWYGDYKTPKEIAEQAKFTNEGYYIWVSGDEFLPFDFKWRYYNRDIGKIKEILFSEDNACTVRVSYGRAYHWLAVIGWDSKNGELIGADPLDGGRCYIEREDGLINGFAEVKRK